MSDIEKVCALCDRPIRKRPVMLPGGDRKPAHWNCWRLMKQREKYGEPSATRLGEAKELHRQAVKRARDLGERP